MRTLNLSCTSCPIIVTVSILLWACGPRAFASNDDDVRAALTARLAALQNLTIATDVDELHFPESMPATQPALAKIGEKTVAFYIGPDGYTEKLSYLNGRVFYERQRSETLPSYSGIFFSREIYTPERYEELQQQYPKGHLVGGIHDHATNKYLDSVADVALGIRAYQSDVWFSPDDFKNMEFSYPGDDSVIGKLVHHHIGISGGKSDIIDEFTFSRKLGYAISSYRRLRQASGITRPHVLMRNDDFQATAGIMLPRHAKVTQIVWSPDDKPVNVDIADTSFRLIKIGDPNNVESIYRMEWPTGAAVIDMRADVHMVVTGKPRTLSDAEEADVLRKAAEDQRKATTQAQELIDKINGPGNATQPAP